MGNTFDGAVSYLRDPHLVRRIQERFGVKQILVSGDQRDKAINPDSDSDPDFATSNASDVANPSTSSEAANGGGGFINGSTIEWLATKAKVRHRRLKQPTSTHSPADKPPSSSNSKNTQNQVEIVVESIPLFDIYFRLASELGYEPFYITFIPFLFWNVDTLLARHVVLLWCVSMYIGQACKALFKWSRPASPPAFRLEQNPGLETEYGFPSTHAIVSTTFPFYFLYSCFGRYVFPLWIGLIVAVIWTISVCLSRIYLGVHTVMDIIGGIAISLGILATMVPFISLLDMAIFSSSLYAAMLMSLAVVVLLYIYPISPDKWTMDRGDTAAILGTALGLVCGFCGSGPRPDDLLEGPFVIVVPSLGVVSVSVVRFVIGILLILPPRFIMKILCFKLLPAIMPTHGVEDVRQRPLVELPYKIITYGFVGFNFTYIVPIVFSVLDICRWPDQ